LPTATILAGNTSVTVTHTLGYTPDLDDITVTPQDDLGGISFWPSTPTATTFLINMGSMDVADHSFSYDFLRTSAPVGPGYCTYVDVRDIIETSLPDVRITALIALADAEIDGKYMDTRPADELRLISMLITASLIAGREPSSRSTGGASETYRSADSWRKLADEQIGRTGDLPLIVYTAPIEE
jgi:hypothetical protein